MDSSQTSAVADVLGQEKALELQQNADTSQFSQPTIFDVIKAG